MLARIKTIHSIIWIVMVSAIFYILYAGISNNINIYLWIPIGLIVVEVIVLAIFKGSCPLTIVAKKIKEDYHDGDDIFLPKWLAIHNKLVFSTILFVGILIIIFRLLSN